MKSASLRLNGFFGRTFWLTVFLLVFFVALGEWVTQLEVFQSYFTPPRLGSRHSQLGYKLYLLNAEVKRNGPIDCIMVGSSTVDVGFDPEIFQKAYLDVAGREIRCFNFGIDASSAISVEVLARILIEDYQPRLLIFGTDARDYAVQREDQDTAVVLTSPWIMYRDGFFSLDGWLLDHSYLYRYRQHLARLTRLQFQGTLAQTEMIYKLRLNGMNPVSIVSTYINDPPEPEDDSYEVVYYNRIYSSYQMLDENLGALEKILDHEKSGTRVIVVEMPVSDGLYYFFDNGEADYNRFIARMDELTARYQVPFLRTEPLDFIPDDGWSDYSHLNIAGAQIFSDWLGRQVAVINETGSAGLSQP